MDGLVKKHSDTVIVLGGILSAVFWMNGKFSEVYKRFSSIDMRLIRMETVLILKGIMPSELVINTEKNV